MDHTNSDFCFALLTTRPTLDPGNYTIVIDAIWNESSKFDEKYDDVLLRVYCKDQLSL